MEEDRGIIPVLEKAIAARQGYFDERHENAFRLLSGFYEGSPDLTIDLYARTLLFHSYARSPEQAQDDIDHIQGYLLALFPWVQAVIVKSRLGKSPPDRNGRLVFGAEPDRKVRENGVWYALDLLLNRDASLYLDTRNLRLWAKANLKEKTVLNTFAYTGSLGAAARAGGASQVVHLDRSRRFLNLAKDTYSLNGFPIQPTDFRSGDFFEQTGQMRRSGETFDCVFIDPPFFSSGDRGRIDLNRQGDRLINKVRPLVNEGGWLAAVNNALYVSGAVYLRLLEELGKDGYLSIEQIIPVPEDVTGFPGTIVTRPPADPAPFNHPTKIVILRVRKKL